jgi:hypothetical protein
MFSGKVSHNALLSHVYIRITSVPKAYWMRSHCQVLFWQHVLQLISHKTYC